MAVRPTQARRRALVSYLVEPYFHWNSRTESFLIGALIVIAAMCALLLKVRLFHRLELWDVCIPLILFTPFQFGQIFVVANWAHGPLPLLLIILYSLAWTIANLRWRYALVLAINFLTIYTGFGLFLGLLTPFIITVDYLLNLKAHPRGKIYFAGALLVSLLSFGSFFVPYVYAPAVACRPNLFQSPTAYAKFVLLMFGNVIGAKGVGLLPALAGATLLVCMLLVLGVNYGMLRDVKTDFRPHIMRNANSLCCAIRCCCRLWQIMSRPAGCTGFTLCDVFGTRTSWAVHFLSRYSKPKFTDSRVDIIDHCPRSHDRNSGISAVLDGVLPEVKG